MIIQIYKKFPFDFNSKAGASKCIIPDITTSLGKRKEENIFFPILILIIHEKYNPIKPIQDHRLCSNIKREKKS